MNTVALSELNLIKKIKLPREKSQEDYTTQKVKKVQSDILQSTKEKIALTSLQI